MFSHGILTSRVCRLISFFNYNIHLVLNFSIWLYFLTDNASSCSSLYLSTSRYKMVRLSSLLSLSIILSNLQVSSSSILQWTNLSSSNCDHTWNWSSRLVSLFFFNVINWYSRFANCYFNYGSDQETRDYIQPFLNDEFNGEGSEFIGALYYVRSTLNFIE